MSTIFPHTNTEAEVDYNLVSLGDVVLGFGSRNITTKTYKNTIVIVGNSKRNLKDFIEYFSYADGAILRFFRGRLTTTVPNIFLRDIVGVNISGNGDYLAVNSLGQIINVFRKEYQVKELSDVVDSVAPNKFALTYRANSGWEYRPEASALGRFDDVTFAVVPYGVFVSYFALTNQGGFGNTFRILPLEIRWDSAPRLGADLDCNGRVINNLQYLCQNLEATQPLSSLSVDTIAHSEANITCTTAVKVLALDLIVNKSHLKFFTLNVVNFSGILSFNAQADIVFENGYIPKTQKPDNTYTLLLYKDDVRLKVVIIYKNRNLAKYG